MITQKLATAILLIEEARDLLDGIGQGDVAAMQNIERVKASLSAQRLTLTNELHYAEKKQLAEYKKLAGVL